MQGASNAFARGYQESQNIAPLASSRLNKDFFDESSLDPGIDFSRKNGLNREIIEFNQFSFSDTNLLYEELINDSNGQIQPDEIIRGLLSSKFPTVFAEHLTAIYKFSPKFFNLTFFLKKSEIRNGKNIDLPSSTPNDSAFHLYELYIFSIFYIVFIHDNQENIRGILNTSADPIIDWVDFRFSEDLRATLHGPDSIANQPSNFRDLYLLRLNPASPNIPTDSYLQISKLSEINSKISSIDRSSKLNTHFNSYDKALDLARNYSISISNLKYINLEIDDNHLLFDAEAIEIGAINRASSIENELEFFNINVDQNRQTLQTSQTNLKQLEHLFNNFSALKLIHLSFSPNFFASNLTSSPIAHLVFPGIHTETRAIIDNFDRNELRIPGHFVSKNNRFVFIPHINYVSFIGPRTEVANFKFYIDVATPTVQFINFNRSNLFQLQYLTGDAPSNNDDFQNSTILVNSSKIIDLSLPPEIVDQVDVIDFNKWLSIQPILPNSIKAQASIISPATQKQDYLTIVDSVILLNSIFTKKQIVTSPVSIDELLNLNIPQLSSIANSLNGPLTTIDQIRDVLFQLTASNANPMSFVALLRKHLALATEFIKFKSENGLIDGRPYAFDKSSGIFKWLRFSEADNPTYHKLVGKNNDITRFLFFDFFSSDFSPNDGIWIYSNMRNLLQRILPSPSSLTHFSNFSPQFLSSPTASNISIFNLANDQASANFATISPYQGSIIGEIMDSSQDFKLLICLDHSLSNPIWVENLETGEISYSPGTYGNWTLASTDEEISASNSELEITISANLSSGDISLESSLQNPLVPSTLNSNFNPPIEISNFLEFAPLSSNLSLLDNYWNRDSIHLSILKNSTSNLPISSDTFNEKGEDGISLISIEGEFINDNVIAIDDQEFNIIGELEDGTDYFNVIDGFKQIFYSKSSTPTIYYFVFDKWSQNEETGSFTRNRYSCPIIQLGEIPHELPNSPISFNFAENVNTSVIPYIPYEFKQFSQPIIPNSLAISGSPNFSQAITSIDSFEISHSISKCGSYACLNRDEFKQPVQALNASIRNASIGDLLLNLTIL